MIGSWALVLGGSGVYGWQALQGLSPAAADVAAGEAEESRPGTSEGAAAPAVAEEVQ